MATHCFPILMLYLTISSRHTTSVLLFYIFKALHVVKIAISTALRTSQHCRHIKNVYVCATFQKKQRKLHGTVNLNVSQSEDVFSPMMLDLVVYPTTFISSYKNALFFVVTIMNFHVVYLVDYHKTANAQASSGATLGVNGLQLFLQ
jgi:hypothetical protein